MLTPDDMNPPFMRALRMIMSGAFALLFAVCTVRVAWQGEWAGAATAGAITALLVATAVRNWRRLYEARRAAGAAGPGAD